MNFQKFSAAPLKAGASIHASLLAGSAAGAILIATATSPAIAQTAPAQAAGAAGPIALPTLAVEGEGADAKPLETETGLAVMPGTIQDTPQAVVVVGQELMKTQGVSSLGQALRNVPGITVSIGEGGSINGDQFRIRGFDASNDVYIDGLRDFGVYTRDSFNFQEVQVLEGPSGAMFGRGAVGGAINTVSKKPTLQNSYSFDGFVGNGDYYRGLIDLNEKINDSTAIRLNLMGNSTGVVDRNYSKSDRWGIAPTIEFGIGTDTTFTFGYLHQSDDRVPDYGVVVAQVSPTTPIAKPVTEFGVPRDTFLGFSADTDQTSADIITAQVSHRATDWLTLTSDSRVGIYSRYFRYTSTDNCSVVACAGPLFTNPNNSQAAMGGGGPYDQSAKGVQNISTARADFDIGQFKNEAIVGVDLSYNESKKTFSFYTLPPASSGLYTLNGGAVARGNIGRFLFGIVNTPYPGYNVFNPALGSTAAQLAGTSAASTSVLYNNADATDIGGFVTDRFWFTDQWSVIGSIRVDNYDSNYSTTTIAGTAAQLNASNFLTNPRASLIYEPDNTQTYYFSYGKSSTPQGTSAVNSATPLTLTAKDLKPEETETFELGAKYGLFNGRLATTASLFDTKKDNATMTDPNTGDVNVQSGQKQEVRGLQLGLTGKITPEWSMNIGYTYLDSKVTSDLTCGTTAPIICKPNVFTVGQRVPLVPKNAATLWTDYDLKDYLPGLAVSGGVTYQDPILLGFQFNGTAPNLTGVLRKAYAPYTLQFDAVVSYKIDRYEFALNMYNLTNRLNYTSLFSNRAVPAAGRTFIFSFGAYFGEPDAAVEKTAAYVAPPVVAPMAAPKSYLVFFDFNKSDLTPQAATIVDQAAHNAAPAKVTQLTVTGHTDTVGSDAYNMRLSRRRAESVAAQLEKDGIPASEIAIVAKGKRDLLVPTGDGVKEPQNRRVQIVYDGGPGV